MVGMEQAKPAQRDRMEEELPDGNGMSEVGGRKQRMSHSSSLGVVASVMLVCVSLGSLVGVADARSFRYGHISWATCESGFYDPFFPEICTDRSDPLRVAFTINCAWTVESQDNPITMLQNVFTDVSNYKNSNGETRLLRLSRNPPDHGVTVERRIGYRVGLGDESLPVPDDGGIVNCPKPPCPALTDNYEFQIDRLSLDESTVYARYTFEILFPEASQYTVFFEGCCRPPSGTSEPIYTLNAASLPFHLRTELSLEQFARPSHSIRFSMPDFVHLKKHTEGDCGSEVANCNQLGCFLDFQLHAFHPQEDFKSRIRYRLANTKEMGFYKCLEHIDTADAASDLINVGRCGSNALRENDYQPAPGIIVSSTTGKVTFPVGQSGIWAVSIVAFCDGCTVGNQLKAPLEFLIRVSDTANTLNFFQPRPVHPAPGGASEVLGAAPRTSRDAPISIRCGRTLWELAAAQSSDGLAYSADHLRVAFLDVYQPEQAGCPSDDEQTLAHVTQAASLPTGVQLGPMEVTATFPSPWAAGFIDVTWRPACEDPSQVGLFMFCFEAQDKTESGGAFFSPLVSAPSIVAPGDAAPAHPACVFVNSLPPGENPAPAFSAPTQHRTCSADCCDCCGTPSCACEGVTACCLPIYAQTGERFTLPIRAVDEYRPQNVSIEFSTPNGISPLPNGVAPPVYMPLKFGCGSPSAGGDYYEDCESRPSEGWDATGQLSWDLTALAEYQCLDGATGQRVPCAGTEDTTTCSAPGSGACEKSQAQRTVLPFKVCYQARELTAFFVDEELWQRTYGQPPGNHSCIACFILNVADRPFFIDFDAALFPIGTLPNNFEVRLAAFEPFEMDLTAASSNPTQVVDINLLNDPGAPVGASLGAQSETIFTGIYHQKAFTRKFFYTPSASQIGLSFRVCFQGVDGEDQRSQPRCFTLRVLEARPVWAQTRPCPGYAGDLASPDMPCPPIGREETVTIGCQYQLSLVAMVERYAAQIVEQRAPSCPTCGPHGVSVPMCGSPGAGSDRPCCGNGYCDGAETGASCPADCPADDAALEQVEVGRAQNGWATRAEFTWRPTRGMDGRSLLRCFSVNTTGTGSVRVLEDSWSEASAPAFCVVYHVERCTYCVPEHATMKSVASHYILNMDWLRVYNANPTVANPDLLLMEPNKIFLGPNYVVQPGDTLLSIAALAKTTLKSILENNPDITEANKLQAGQEVCLLLCSSAPIA